MIRLADLTQAPEDVSLLPWLTDRAEPNIVHLKPHKGAIEGRRTREQGPMPARANLLQQGRAHIQRVMFGDYFSRGERDPGEQIERVHGRLVLELGTNPGREALAAHRDGD